MEDSIKKTNALRKLLSIAFGLYCIVLAYVLFVWSTPIGSGNSWRSYNLTPFTEIAGAYMEGGGLVHSQFVLNIILFVPLGFALPLLWPRFAGTFWKTALITLLFTALVETVQYYIGRFADIDDVIANLLGGVAGYALYTLALGLFGRTKKWPDFAQSDRRAGVFALIAALLALTLIFGAPFALDKLDAASPYGLMRYVSHTVPIGSVIACDIDDAATQTSITTYGKRKDLLESTLDMVKAAFPPENEPKRVDFNWDYYGDGATLSTQDNTWYLTAYEDGRYHMQLTWPDAPFADDLDAFLRYVRGVLPALTQEGVVFDNALAYDNAEELSAQQSNGGASNAGMSYAMGGEANAAGADESACYVTGGVYFTYQNGVFIINSTVSLALPSGECALISPAQALRAARGPGAQNTAYTNVVIEGVELVMREISDHGDGRRFARCYRFYGKGTAFGSERDFEAVVDAQDYSALSE